MTDEIKVFALNDHDYIAARTLEEACGFWKDEMGYVDGAEFDREMLDSPHALSDEEMTGLIMSDEDDPNYHESFRDALAEMIKDGGAFPRIFCCSE